MFRTYVSYPARTHHPLVFRSVDFTVLFDRVVSSLRLPTDPSLSPKIFSFALVLRAISLSLALAIAGRRLPSLTRTTVSCTLFSAPYNRLRKIRFQGDNLLFAGDKFSSLRLASLFRTLYTNGRARERKNGRKRKVREPVTRTTSRK